MMNGNDDLLRDGEQSDTQRMTTSPPKKKCRGNRKEQHARRRLRKRDLNEATVALRMNMTTETQLTDEPVDSITVTIEETTQV